MNKSFVKIVNLVLLIIAFVAVVSPRAEVYVSFKGGFYIEYPDNWEQIDYHTADAFLVRTTQDRSALEYEAVFAPKSSSPFFAKDYLILTIDTVDWLYEYREDSIVAEMKKGFGEGIDYFPSWDKPGDVKTNQPVYDKAKHVVSVVNDIVEGDNVVKKSLFVRKFHDKGIANFYFYAPDSLFENSLATFQSIVNSFGTENIQDKLPKENVEVASDVNDDRAIDYKTMVIAIALAIVIVMVIIIRTKKASKRKEGNLNS